LQIVLVLVACGRQGEPEVAVGVTPAPEVPVETVAPLRVEFGGCEGGERGTNTCVLPSDGLLALWVEGEGAPHVRVDGVDATPLDPVGVDGGLRFHVAVPKGANRLVVERDGVGEWSLGVSAAAPEPRLDAIIATLPDQNSAGRSPKLEVALERIERELPQMAPLERVSALRLATVLTWDLGRDGAAYGNRALTAAIESGDAARVVDTANILMYMLDEASAEASWVLDLESLYVANVEDGIRRARWEIDVANHANKVGEASRAIEYFRLAEARARRLGRRTEELAASAALSTVLGSHGRETERTAVVQRLLARVKVSNAETACWDASNVTDVAGSFVYAKLAGASTADPEPTLQLAIAKFESDPVRCKVGDNAAWQDAHALARANYVLSAVLDRRWDVVDERLRWFDSHPAEGNRHNSVMLSRAELALARGDLAAARRHVGAVVKPHELVAWRHQIVRGQIAERSGNTADALVSYRAAERIVDEMAAGAGLEPARDGATVGIHLGAANAIALLAMSGDPQQAATVARASRARALRPAGRAARLAVLSPDARRAWADAIRAYDSARDRIAKELTDAWSMPIDERAAMLRGHEKLRGELQAAHERAFEILATAKATKGAIHAPEPGALWLVFHPAARGWHGVALRAGGARVVTVDVAADAPMSTLGPALLESFDEEIAGATEIKILAMGRLLDVPFHEVLWRGKPLIVHVPVSWAVDIGHVADVVPRSPSSHALIVADPATMTPGVGRLPHAAEEAKVVAAALSGRGLPVETLVAEQATLPTVLAQLGGATWLHYAGHGFSDTTSAWDAALPLAGEAQLTVRDILTGARVPSTVVLSGCRTAATNSGGLSLATAFVLAGSRAVVGSTSDLEDADARAMSAALYRHLEGGEGPGWVRAAILDGLTRDEAWTSSIRVWSP
jgi:hypothetical protein